MNAPVVHLVDDDAAFLAALGRLLKAARYTVKSYTSPEALLDGLADESPGCVLADLHMPRMNGLELQAALARSRNPLPVVFLTGAGDIPATVQAMQRGAEDFLTKLAPKEKILEAIERALARDARERPVRLRRVQLRTLFAGLTTREREVLGHVVLGQQNKQIAADLGINERTVKLHRTAITTKFGVPSVAELTRLWVEFNAGV